MCSSDLHGHRHQEHVYEYKEYRERAACHGKNFAGKVKGRFVPDIMEDIPKRPLGYHAINILVGKIVKADAVPERRQEGKG